jgi:hypothetical protein
MSVKTQNRKESIMNMLKNITAALALTIIPTAIADDDFSIDWHTVDGGGVMAGTGGDFELSGTVGQPDAGATMTGGEFSLTGGFWAAAAAQSSTPCGENAGDFDSDGDVDLVDFGEFQLCFTGGTGTVAEGCECADFDGDNDADLVDFGEFQLAFTG